jgi:hypothetical protein
MVENSDSGLKRFQAAAKAFIEVVDTASNRERGAFLAAISGCLAELYSSALTLPAVEPDMSGADGSVFPEAEWSRLYLSLKETIGGSDAYWTVFDSTEKSEPVQGSLAQDLLEIYRDLKDGLQLEQENISRADLLYELRESFREHWGRHALEALKATRDLHA